MDDGDLAQQQLDVYMTREGPWNPEHGDLEIPEAWDFLPSGDAFVTRRVKAKGTYWVAWRPRGRNRLHRRRLGLWAPKESIEEARAEAAATEERRTKQREQGATARKRQEVVSATSSLIRYGVSSHSLRSTPTSPTRSPRKLLPGLRSWGAVGSDAPGICRWMSALPWRHEQSSAIDTPPTRMTCSMRPSRIRGMKGSGTGRSNPRLNAPSMTSSTSTGQAVGVGMGEGVAILMHHELASVADEDLSRSVTGLRRNRPTLRSRHQPLPKPPGS